MQKLRLLALCLLASSIGLMTACDSSTNSPAAPTSTTLAVGGPSSTAPSYISLGTNPPKTFTTVQTNDSASRLKIDLFAHADINIPELAIFESTDQALFNGALPSAFSDTRSTDILLVTTAPTTKAAASAILDTSTLVAQNANIVSGGIYLTMNQDSVFSVLKVSNVNGVGDAITFSVNITTLK